MALVVAATVRAYPGCGTGGNIMPEVAQTPRRMLRTPEAAAYCGSSASTFEKLRLSGGGPGYVKMGRRVVYDPTDLDAWLAANRRVSTSDPGAGE
jgi:predicted DNA-binding transcriptional regulator AlpA